MFHDLSRIFVVLMMLLGLFIWGCGGADERGVNGDSYAVLDSTGTPVATSFSYPFSDGTRSQFRRFGVSQGCGAWSSWGGGRHLALDVSAPSGTPVFAAADGIVRVSDGASHTFRGYGNHCGGYGRLVVVEHALVDGSHITSLYGHVRSGVYNEAMRAGLVPEGTVVRQGQYIATIADYWAETGSDSRCDDANWAHLHWGLRLGSFDAANTWRYAKGYSGLGEDVDVDTSGATRGGHWTNADVFVENHPLATTPDPSSSATTTPASATSSRPLTITWNTPGGATASRITMSGRITTASGATSDWAMLGEVRSQSSITVDVTTAICGHVELSTEFVEGATTCWSCTGSSTVNGALTANWGTVSTTPISNGLGGCNLRVDVPCGATASGAPSESSSGSGGAGSSSGASASGSSGSSGSGGASSGASGSSDSGSSTSTNTITCAMSGGSLVITMHGALTADTLVGGALDLIGFVAVGSNETGWTTQTTAPAYFGIWNGASFPVMIAVPDAVNRFNLWAGGASGTRWLNLARWTASGAGCHITPDGSGGLIITR